MSCSVCRLAFVPGPLATSPLPAHFPPHEVMSRSSGIYSYFTGAIGIGRPEVHSLKARFDYVSANMFSGFNGMMVLCVVWETMNGTAFMMHTGCANLFFHRMDIGLETLERATSFCEVVGVLERPMGGKDAGRLVNVKYESVGEKIDLNPFWRAARAEGGNVFDWKALSQSPYAFLINKPNVFPRFFDQVASTRLANLEGVEFDNKDALTELPLDILESLIPHLEIKSYVNLMSTCRFLRLHALTTFQPHARRFVLQLPWSIPVAAELEEMSPASAAKLPNGDNTAHDADWYLYLSHIHRTKSMRARRWIWALLDEIHGQFVAKRETSPAMVPGTTRYREVHMGMDMAWQMSQMGEMMKTKMNSMKK